jgi:ABC-type dipeptide/oligopeptide/nickel transport system permease subunit
VIRRSLSRSPAAIAGLLIVTLAMGLAIISIEFVTPREARDDVGARSLLSRLLLTYGPNDVDREIKIAPSPPDARHWLGTDHQQRDLLSRLLHGARLSIQVGLFAEAIALLIGMAVGALAGFYGGRLDSCLMRAADVLLALPLPIMAMAAIAVFESPGIVLVFVVLGLLGWAGIARLVRAQCLSVRALGYPEAARALGAGDLRLIALHVLPNAAAPAIVAASVGVAGNILAEAWLSFLGLGAQPPAVSWGQMIVDAQGDLASRPWLCIFPGLALALTVLGFVLLADGLRDALDPKMKMATHIT